MGRDKLYLAAAISCFIVCGLLIANEYYVLAPFWAAAGGIWLYLWRKK